MKRLIAHRGAGTGKGVAFTSLPPHSNIWTDIQPLDVSQGAARGVAQQRPGANRRIADRGVIKEGERPISGVIGGANIAQERPGARGRIRVSSVRKECSSANTGAEIAVGEA